MDGDEMKNHILCYFGKGQDGDTLIATCTDGASLDEFARHLNATIGYLSGVGIWSQKAPGYYFTRTVEDIPSDGLYLRRSEIVSLGHGHRRS
jgi:hypothetical protein